MKFDELSSAAIWSKVLTEDELGRVAEESSVRDFNPGEYVISNGEMMYYWTGVVEGLLKMSVDSRDGRSCSFTGVSSGGWFGEGTLLKREKSRYDMIALRRSRLILVPATTFDRLVSTSLAFNRFLVNYLNARLSLLLGVVEHERLLSPDERVAQCITDLFEPTLYPNASPALRISQEEVGLLCGLSRQRTNRALKFLEKEGLIKLDFHGLEVLNLAELRRRLRPSSLAPCLAL